MWETKKKEPNHCLVKKKIEQKGITNDCLEKKVNTKLNCHEMGHFHILTCDEGLKISFLHT